MRDARSCATLPLASWLLVPLVSLAGCSPNLTVRNAAVSWNETTKLATVEVTNLGHRAAPEFFVAFTGEESPVSPNHRPQVQHRVAGLAAGASVQLTADFGPLAHPDNASLRNVFQIRIVADPKDLVAESREDDNAVTVRVPPLPCPVISSDVASGTAGAITIGQSFNETRAVRATVLGSTDRLVQKLVLRGLNIGSATSALVGARIYDDATHAVIASASASAASGMGQTVEVPVTAALRAGKTYRIGFYVETNPQGRGSGNFFAPSGFSSLPNPTPYTESWGAFRIESAHAVGADAFPSNPNIFVPQMTIVSGCSSATAVNQSNLVSTGNVVVNDAQSVGQTFVVSRAGRLVGVEIAAVRCAATTSDVLTMEVGQGSASLGSVSITGAGLLGPGQCGVVPAALSATARGPAYFDLAPLNLAVTAGPTYSFRLTTASNRDFRVGMSSDLYAGGTALVNGNPSSFDLAFTVEVAP